MSHMVRSILVAFGLGMCSLGAAAEEHESRLTIAALGTSLTHEGGWLESLEQTLSSCLDRPIRVLDFGRNGANSSWGVTAIDQIISETPNIVLVEFSVNDANLFKGQSLARSEENIRLIVRDLRHAISSIEIYLMTINPVFGWRSLIRPNLEIYYGNYKKLAAKLNVGYIDNRQRWSALSREELRAGIPDGLHPQAKLAGRLVAPSIASAIVHNSRRCGETVL